MSVPIDFFGARNAQSPEPESGPEIDFFGARNEQQAPPQIVGDEPPDISMDDLVQDDRSFLEWAVDTYTGDKVRQFDYEEIPTYTPISVPKPDGTMHQGEIPIHGILSVARDNQVGRAEIFQKFYPDANIEYDEYGNAYTDRFGKPMYLNRPGASKSDLIEAGTLLPQEMLAAYAGGAAGRFVLGRFGQIVGAGAALMTTSIGQDKVAEIMGSSQPIDWKRAQIMGLFGAGGEAAGILFGKFLTRVFTSPKLFKDGALTKRGRKILEDAEIDPDQITPEFVRVWQGMVDDAIDPALAATSAEASTLPRAVRMSEGDLTRDVTQQAFESSAAKGVYGEGAKNEMRAFREAQQEDLRANQEAIQGQFSPTGQPRVSYSGEGMISPMRALHAQKLALHRRMKRQYRIADETGMRVDSAGLQVVLNNVDDAMKTFDPALVPDAIGVLRKGLRPRGRGGARIKKLNIHAMENLRKRMVRIRDGSTIPAEAEAARKAIQAFDEGIDAAIEQGLYTGNTRALKAFKEGRKTRRLMAKMFEEDRLIARILRTRDGKIYDVLDATPEEAANVLFTANSIGKSKSLGGKTGADQALRKIKQILGEDHPGWKSIREEAIYRLFSSADSMDVLQDGVTRAFSGQKFANTFDNAMQEHRSLMTTLFDQSEIAQLRRMRNVAHRATTPIRGAVNTSDTATEVARIFQNIFGASATKLQLIMQTIKKNYAPIRDAEKARRATGQMGGARLRGATLDPGVAGAAGAYAASEEDRLRRLTRRGYRQRTQR